MNRLKKFVISFVLPFFCLLISVSNGQIIEAGVNYTTGGYSTTSVNSYGNYSYSQAATIIINYVSNKELYSDEFNSFVSYIYETYNFNSYLLQENFNSDGSLASNNHYLYFFNSDDEVAVDSLTKQNNSFYYYGINLNESDTFLEILGNTGSYGTLYTITRSGFKLYSSYYSLGLYSNRSIKEMTITRDADYNYNFYWDGVSYYYKADVGGGEEEPTLPTNAEIAQAVQAFYNSDYYKNNTDFDNFIVLYNYDTKYFDFVGHNFGSDLGQVIVPPNYEYEGYSYNQDWWKFFLRNISAEVASNLWNRYYWLYSTNDFGENITYDGKGSIRNLIDLHFSTKSIIVYSTTDYPVVKIETDDNGVLNPVEGTIPGDQYTYDENLDPTTNEYNPLENFVPTNPIQDILGDVDFDEINKTFEDNKNILDIENASWLFAANNNFISYFVGFLSLLIVFLLISRILGG